MAMAADWFCRLIDISLVHPAEHTHTVVSYLSFSISRASMKTFSQYSCPRWHTLAPSSDNALLTFIKTDPTPSFTAPSAHWKIRSCTHLSPLLQLVTHAPHWINGGTTEEGWYCRKSGHITSTDCFNPLASNTQGQKDKLSTKCKSKEICVWYIMF